jgi:hypothetical protein
MWNFCKYDELLTLGVGEQEGAISSLTFGVVPPIQHPASDGAIHVLYLLYPNCSRSLPIAARCIFHKHTPSPLAPAHPSILLPLDSHIAITANEGLRRLCFSSSALVAFIASYHPLDRTSASSLSNQHLMYLLIFLICCLQVVKTCDSVVCKGEKNFQNRRAPKVLIATSLLRRAPVSIGANDVYYESSNVQVLVLPNRQCLRLHQARKVPRSHRTYLSASKHAVFVRMSTS